MKICGRKKYYWSDPVFFLFFLTCEKRRIYLICPTGRIVIFLSGNAESFQKRAKKIRFTVKWNGKHTKVVHPVGLEPATFWSVARCSIQLSYGCISLTGEFLSINLMPLIYTRKQKSQIKIKKKYVFFTQLSHNFSKNRYFRHIWAGENWILKKWFCQIFQTVWVKYHRGE